LINSLPPIASSRSYVSACLRTFASLHSMSGGTLSLMVMADARCLLPGAGSSSQSSSSSSSTRSSHLLLSRARSGGMAVCRRDDAGRRASIGRASRAVSGRFRVTTLRRLEPRPRPRPSCENESTPAQANNKRIPIAMVDSFMIPALHLVAFVRPRFHLSATIPYGWVQMPTPKLGELISRLLVGILNSFLLACTSLVSLVVHANKNEVDRPSRSRDISSPNL